MMRLGGHVFAIFAHSEDNPLTVVEIGRTRLCFERLPTMRMLLVTSVDNRLSRDVAARVVQTLSDELEKSASSQQPHQPAGTATPRRSRASSKRAAVAAVGQLPRLLAAKLLKDAAHGSNWVFVAFVKDMFQDHLQGSLSTGTPLQYVYYYLISYSLRFGHDDFELTVMTGV